MAKGQGKGSKKIGRDQAKCKLYEQRGTRKKNQLRRQIKRLKNFRSNKGVSIQEIKKQAMNIVYAKVG